MAKKTVCLEANTEAPIRLVPGMRFVAQGTKQNIWIVVGQERDLLCLKRECDNFVHWISEVLMYKVVDHIVADIEENQLSPTIC